MRGEPPITVEEFYGPWPISHEARGEIMGRSRDPLGPDSLFEVVASLGVGAEDVVLDIGARDARHSITLAERFGSRVIAVDPVATAVEKGREAVADRGLADRVEVVVGGIESIPLADDAVDVVFARDMLNHVENLALGLGECRRVLRPGGAMVVFHTFATDRLYPEEAAELFSNLALVPERQDVADFERHVEQAGFTVEELVITGSQWREYLEEEGEGRTSRQLLEVARLRRLEDEMRAELGDIPYRVELANALWGVYSMIGKLEGRIYVLRG